MVAIQKTSAGRLREGGQTFKKIIHLYAPKTVGKEVPKKGAN